MSTSSPTYVLILLLKLLLLGQCTSSTAAPKSLQKTKHSKGGGNDLENSDSKSADEALLVHTVQLENHDIHRYYLNSGTLTAQRKAEIRALQSGIMVFVGVEEGDRVRQGQLLAKLDHREFALQEQLDRLQAENAERELNRIEEIADLNVIAKEELDRQRHAWKTAKATTNLSHHRVKQHFVRAPFAGTITARNLDEGNFASSASVMFELSDLSALELDLFIPEREAMSIAIGTTVLTELVDKTVFTQKIIRKAPIVDPLTGTVKFTASAEIYPKQAVPGAFVRSKILLEKRESVQSLPRTAIFDVDGQTHVFVIENGLTKRTAIKTGLSGEDKVEIIEGISKNDIVVEDGADLSAGTPVKAMSSGKQAPHPQPKQDLTPPKANPTPSNPGKLSD